LSLRAIEEVGGIKQARPGLPGLDGRARRVEDASRKGYPMSAKATAVSLLSPLLFAGCLGLGAPPSARTQQAPARKQETPALLRWNFVPGTRYVYDYRQVLTIRSDGAPGRDPTRIQSEGAVNMACGEGRARVTMKDRNRRAGAPGVEESSSRFVLLPDGSVEGAVRTQPEGHFLLTCVLLPVPRGELRPGETLREDVVMRSEGAFKEITGWAEFRLKGRERSEGRDLVSYTASCALGAGGEIEPGVVAKFGAEAEAEAVFDAAAGRLVTVDGRVTGAIDYDVRGRPSETMSQVIEPHLRFVRVERVEGGPGAPQEQNAASRGGSLLHGEF